MKYEYKERYSKLDGKEIVIKDLVLVDGLKITDTLNYNNQKQIVQLKKLNNDIAIYVKELFYGKTFGSKEYFVFDRKTNLVVNHLYTNPKKDDLKSFTNSKLHIVREEGE